MPSIYVMYEHCPLRRYLATRHRHPDHHLQGLQQLSPPQHLRGQEVRPCHCCPLFAHSMWLWPLRSACCQTPSADTCIPFCPQLRGPLPTVMETKLMSQSVPNPSQPSCPTCYFTHNMCQHLTLCHLLATSYCLSKALQQGPAHSGRICWMNAPNSRPLWPTTQATEYRPFWRFCSSAPAPNQAELITGACLLLLSHPELQI